MRLPYFAGLLMCALFGLHLIFGVSSPQARSQKISTSRLLYLSHELWHETLQSHVTTREQVTKFTPPEAATVKSINSLARCYQQAINIKLKLLNLTWLQLKSLRNQKQSAITIPNYLEQLVDIPITIPVSR